MDQRSCIGYERGVIRSPVESLVQRTVTTSVFPTFLLSLITFPLLFTCISIYPINILLSPVPSPIFTNCTPASNRLFRHLCTNTPLPCLVCWFLQGGRRYSQNITELFEWQGLRGTYSLSFLRWLLRLWSLNQIQNFDIFCQYIRSSVATLHKTTSHHWYPPHGPSHCSLPFTPSLRYYLDSGFVSIRHGGATLPKSVIYIILHLVRNPSNSLSNLRLCRRSII